MGSLQHCFQYDRVNLDEWKQVLNYLSFKIPFLVYSSSAILSLSLLLFFYSLSVFSMFHFLMFIFP